MKDFAKGLVYLGVFAIPFIVLIISNSMFFPFITGKNFTFRIITEIIFAGWIILALYEPAYRPRFSWILSGFVALLGIMAVSDSLGPSPLASFWSNFERMDGYMTLLHTFMYFIVAGSVLTTDKLWDRWFNTTLVAGVILSLYAFAQLSGNITINQGGWRLDGTLGNSAYMAIYTLFHAFIALLMFFRTKSAGFKYLYGGLFLLFTILLVQTATRGTILGLFGGLFAATTYIALFNAGYPQARKFAAGGLISLVVLAGLFITFRESSFIQNNPYLGRLANITLSEGNVRFKVWNMAVEGFKERPLLGWGQSNFNYVFNEWYDPSIYFAEAWYDRVHNIFFDWLITGGILGFVAYFSIYFSALYYLFLRPLITREDKAFSVVERGVLIGLLGGYLVHNFFVFDNIVSYIFYGTMLAYIHSRVGTEFAALKNKRFDTRVIEQVAAPVVGIACLVAVYLINVPGILAAQDIIDAFSSKSPEAAIAEFESALSRGSFANQEVREQMTRQQQSLEQSPEVNEELRQKFKARVEEELLKQIEEKPGDARVHVFISSFYRMIGDTEKAIEQLAIARQLSPNKQQIIFEQGLAYLQKGDYETGLSFMKEAYELDTTYGEAAVFYAAAALYAGKPEIIDEVINTDSLKIQFKTNDMVIQAAYRAKQYDMLKDIFNYRIEKNPSDKQLRVNLAFTLNESGDTAGAIEVLSKAAEDIPEFEAQAQQFIASLLAEKNPNAPRVEVAGEAVEVTE